MMTALSTATIVLALIMGAQGDCYTPMERNGQCSRNWHKLPSTLFGTKTTYPHATGLDSKRAQRVHIEGCTPLLLLLVMRHTTRYPGKKDINKFRTRLPEIRGDILNTSRTKSARLCKDHIDLLKKWKYTWNESDEYQVTISGIKDTAKIASRLQKMFPSLLRDRFEEDWYSVTATSKVRTQDTAKAFLKEILKSKDFKKFKKRGYLQLNDSLLGFDSICEDSLKNQGVDKKESKEEKAFLSGPQVTKMVEAISERIGVNVSAGDVKLMAKVCSFEVALYGWSPFCYLFDREDLDLFEYADDLDDYEKDVYGNERSVAMGCVLVEEILDKIREKVKERITGGHRTHRRLRSALYFTHAPVIKSLIAKFGLGRTEPPLSADNYCHYKYCRPWRSSHMVPFTANIALVLFECGRQSFYVLPLLNEKVLRLPGCRDEFCSVGDFLRTRAALSSRSCELTKICSRDWKPNAGPE